MKLVAILTFMLVTAVGCDPYNFGFKRNPAFILAEAFKSILALNDEKFVEVSGKEALCVYANPEGMAYLRENLNFDQRHLSFAPVKHGVKYTANPEFVGFWSYYSERYLVNIQDKRSGENYVNTVIDCHFGIDGQKNEAFINLPKNKYRRKECRLVKLTPLSFQPLKLPSKCSEIFQVTL